MLTFFAGPAASTSSPRPDRNRIASSRNASSCYHAQPYRKETYHNAEQHVQASHENFAILKAAKRLELEGGERGVAADKTDRYQVSPVWIPVALFGKKSHNQPDEERSRAVHDERAVGKARPHSLAY